MAERITQKNIADKVAKAEPKAEPKKAPAKSKAKKENPSSASTWDLDFLYKGGATHIHVRSNQAYEVVKALRKDEMVSINFPKDPLKGKNVKQEITITINGFAVTYPRGVRVKIPASFDTLVNQAEESKAEADAQTLANNPEKAKVLE